MVVKGRPRKNQQHSNRVDDLEVGGLGKAGVDIGMLVMAIRGFTRGDQGALLVTRCLVVAKMG